MRRTGLTVGAVVVAVTLAGCSKGTAGPQRGPRTTASEPGGVFGDSREKVIADDISWHDRASALMDRITDEAAAEALVPEIRALVAEREKLLARLKQLPDPTPEEKSRTDAVYLEKSKAAKLRFIRASKPFEASYSKLSKVNDLLRKKHGIDFPRWRLVKQ